MLVVIAMLVPTDTSECERIFSLMNDLKTAERNKLGQVNLKNLMMWHVTGKDVKSEVVPVMDILKEFRELASAGGKRTSNALGAAAVRLQGQDRGERVRVLARGAPGSLGVVVVARVDGRAGSTINLRVVRSLTVGSKWC